MTFFGFYGRHNFGDDLFGYLLQRFCADLPGVAPIMVGATPQRELTAAWRPRLLARWLDDRGKRGTIARFITYCAAMARADVAVFGGGSLFGAHASVAFARLIVGWARRWNTPVYALGVSVGPFHSDHRRDAFLELAARLTGLAVRDRASVAAMHGMIGASGRPPNLGDLAFALPAIYRPLRPLAPRRKLVVSIHLVDYVEQAVAVLREADCGTDIDRVCFVSLDSDCAAIAAAILAAFVPSRVTVEHVVYDDSIEAIIDVIASASCVLTSKLHGAITGYVYQVPVLLLCYQRKCADFLDDHALPGPRASNPTPGECVAALRTLLDPVGVREPFEQGDAYRQRFVAFLRDAVDAHGFAPR
ncbi:polysaccharide pyruvyl transferase family protein [Burkholderia sp. BE12]|uniref:polysaccharide pyruvyl transferase family protein n=1 Tax=Burkholderia sp. BE12 TaxID=2082394 RepID=UPI001319F6B5|nr:polysaccharide pyruvyl transferase family protein [Burkholderia sp. BE12]